MEISPKQRKVNVLWARGFNPIHLFGDFYLTGVSILDMKCQILVKEAGHAVHVKTAQILKDKLIKI